jgi:outer membrane protein insertion porin family
MLMGSVEYEHPLVGDDIKGVVFTDFGTLGTGIDEPDAWNLRVTLGVGLRVKIPMFGDQPLAIDFGWAVESEAEDEKQVFAFSMGRDF